MARAAGDGKEELVWSKVGETLVTEERTYRHEESRIDCEWTLVAHGVSETKTTSMRVYGYRELTSLFSEVGFEVSGAFSSLEDEPHELGRRGFFIAEKEAPNEQACISKPAASGGPATPRGGTAWLRGYSTSAL